MAKITLVPGPAPPHKIPQFGVSGDSHPRKSSSEPGELTLNIGFVWNAKLNDGLGLTGGEATLARGVDCV
jgi:hypothetical protein